MLFCQFACEVWEILKIQYAIKLGRSNFLRLAIVLVS
jgi:hypothetical protein